MKLSLPEIKSGFEEELVQRRMEKIRTSRETLFSKLLKHVVENADFIN